MDHFFQEEKMIEIEIKVCINFYKDMLTENMILIKITLTLYLNDF